MLSFRPIFVVCAIGTAAALLGMTLDISRDALVSEEGPYRHIPSTTRVDGLEISPVDRFGFGHATGTIETVSVPAESGEFLMMPFYVSYGGSGQYTYVGLFEYAGDILRYVDAEMIDRRDRIMIVEVDRAETENDFVLHLMSRCPLEGVGADPVAPLTVVMHATSSGIAIVSREESADSAAICATRMKKAEDREQ
jgi:hypothetical protein